jgi:hypothetical protein
MNSCFASFASFAVNLFVARLANPSGKSHNERRVEID